MMWYLVVGLMLALITVRSSMIEYKEPKIITVPIDHVSNLERAESKDVGAWYFVAHSGDSRFLKYICSLDDKIIPHVYASGGMVIVEWKCGDKFVSREILSHTTYEFLVRSS